MKLSTAKLIPAIYGRIGWGRTRLVVL